MLSSGYETITSIGSVLLSKVRDFTVGKLALRGISVFVLVWCPSWGCDRLHVRSTGRVLASSTSKDDAWNYGRIIAAWREHPLATASSECNVHWATSFLKTLIAVSMIIGILVPHPIISIAWMSSYFNPDSMKHCSNTTRSSSTFEAIISSNSALPMFLCKSLSSSKHSILTLDS